MLERRFAAALCWSLGLSCLQFRFIFALSLAVLIYFASVPPGFERNSPALKHCGLVNIGETYEPSWSM